MLKKIIVPRIAHIITDLNGFGGTELTLLRYLKGSKVPCECHLVIVLKSTGVNNTIGAQIVDAGFAVIALDQENSGITVSGLIKIYRELEKFKPDVISGWLYHPSLLATAFAPFINSKPAVVWHIRSLTFATLLKTPVRYVTQLLLVVLSRFTKPFIASNSRAAINEHIAMGFRIPESRLTIILNGINLTEYFPNFQDRLDVRSELGIPIDAVLIGCVGRVVPEKGYPVFFEALRIVRKTIRSDLASCIHFLGAGDGVSLTNEMFSASATKALEIEKLYLLDKRSDVPRLLRALDLFVLPSISEAFPNSLIEAMATGLPCIASDVGECADVMEAQNFIFPPSDEWKLAACICSMLEASDRERSSVGAANQKCVASRFDLQKMVSGFDDLFCNIAIRR